MGKLKGKVAFITGGSRGIGAGIVKRLASEGADVVFTHSGRNGHKAREVLAAIQATGRKGAEVVANNERPEDLIEALENAVDQFGAIDILVNNAGVGMFKPLEEYTLAEFDQCMNVNVKAVFAASQFASRQMKKGSRIIIVGSNLAERVPFPQASVYAMSKSALIGLTKGLARDLGPREITVNLIQPGPTDTDMNPANGALAPPQIALMTLQRYGTVEEIAGLTAYLSSTESQFITGSAITIDGGFNI